MREELAQRRLVHEPAPRSKDPRRLAERIFRSREVIAGPESSKMSNAPSGKGRARVPRDQLGLHAGSVEPALGIGQKRRLDVEPGESHRLEEACERNERDPATTSDLEHPDSFGSLSARTRRGISSVSCRVFRPSSFGNGRYSRSISRIPAWFGAVEAVIWGLTEGLSANMGPARDSRMAAALTPQKHRILNRELILG
jgi:hypothetical protein